MPARRALALALFATAFFFLTSRGLSVGDNALYLDVADHLAWEGRLGLSIDPGQHAVERRPLAGAFFYDEGEGLRSALPPGLSLLALPSALALRAVGVRAAPPSLGELFQPPERPLRPLLRAFQAEPGVFLFASLGPLAGGLSALFFLLCLGELGVGERASVALLLLLVLGGPLGVFAGTCFTQPAATAALLFALHGLLRLRAGAGAKAASALGAGLALSALVRADQGLFVLLFLGAALPILARRWKEGASLGAIAKLLSAIGLPLAAGLGIWVAWGIPTPVGYFPEAIPEGLFGLLLSPLSGLFLFAPALFLLPLAFEEARARFGPFAWLPLVGLALQLALYAGWHDWKASLAYGPRFLVPSAALLLLLLGPAWERSALIRGGAAFGLAAGALISLPGWLLAGPRVPDLQEVGDPLVVEAYRELFAPQTPGGPVGALGVDCASTYVPAYAVAAVAAVTLALALLRREGAEENSVTPHPAE